MNVIRTGLAILLIAGLAHTAEEFEIKAYSPSAGTVEISCGGKITDRPFSSFSPAEQKQITGWLADKEFQSSSGLVIETEKKEVRHPIDVENNTGEPYLTGKSTDVSYTITLENRSEVAFENIEVAYQIFYERCEDSSKEKVRRTGTYYITLAPDSTQTFESYTVSIRDQKLVYLTLTTLDGRDLGKPPKNLQDRLAGLYLCVSKKDASGKRIERECMVGDVPEKEAWAAYKQLGTKPKTVIPRKEPIPRYKSPGSVTQGTQKKETSTPAAKTMSTASGQWSDERIERETQFAEKGNYAAAWRLCGYYSSQGDQEKTKQWAEKTRELLAKRRPDDPMAESMPAEKLLAILERYEQAAKQGARTQTGALASSETWSEEELQKSTKLAQGGSWAAALTVGGYYCGQGDMQKAGQWADFARKRIENLPLEKREAAEKRLADLDQMIKAAAER